MKCIKTLNIWVFFALKLSFMVLSYYCQRGIYMEMHLIPMHMMQFYFGFVLALESAAYFYNLSCGKLGVYAGGPCTSQCRKLLTFTSALCMVFCSEKKPTVSDPLHDGL